MRALEPYPAYRESGVPWLGEVPTHWEVRRIRSIASMLNGATPSSNNADNWGGEITWITPQDLGANSNRYIKASARQITQVGYESCAATIAGNGALAISTRAPIGHVVVLDTPACVNQGCRLIVPTSTSVQPEYLHYGLLVSKEELNSLGQGTTFSELSGGALASFQVPVPPSLEQAAIVRFLDHSDRRIRRFIRAKEKLIALLEEQKQAIIHRAVTGRIDVRTGQPYPAYKPSGVEWLGDVPANWQVLRLGRVIDLMVGFPFKSEDFSQSEEDIRLLRGINVAPGQLRWDEVVRWPADDVDRFSEYQIAVGDIILGMDRPIIGSGIRVAVANESDVPSLLLQRVACIRPARARLAREFALRVLSSNSFLNYLTPIFTGVSVPHLSPEQIRGFWILLPSVAEQEAITKHLTSELGPIQSAAERAQSQISLLREYRTRLIADVVTGKLDVREAEAALPEVDPLAADDEADEQLDAGEEPRLDDDRSPAEFAG